MEKYDAIIIGSGQGGTPLAEAYAAAGKRVALIERDAVGGSCVNYGCTPTKTLVHIAKVAETVRRAEEYGVTTGAWKLDMLKARELKRAIVTEFRDGSAKRLEATKNLDLIYGAAHFVDKKQVEVKLRDGGSQVLEAKEIFIDTGTRPLIPDVPGLKECKYLDNRSIMELDQVPSKLVIIGGGYIALEFGQMFARFGSRVTILEASARFLPKEDEDVADEVQAILEKDGLEIRLGAKVTKVSEENKRITVHTESGEFVSDQILVAAGRIPNTDQLHLEKAGVSLDKKGYVSVDDRLATSAEGIYAIGDVKGGPAFTHISYDDYRVLDANRLHGKDRTIADRMVPYVMYIDPELGRIGISETEAKAKGIKFKVAKLAMTSVARAEEMKETRGFIKAIVSTEDDQILGAAVLGVEGGEIMSMLQVAMMGKITASTLHNAFFAHPTLAELMNNLFS